MIGNNGKDQFPFGPHEVLPVDPRRNVCPPITDQFGMSSFVSFLRGMNRQNAFTVNLAMGAEFSAFNVNMNPRQRDPRHCTFGGPFVGNHKRLQDIPCDTPEEYRVSVLSKHADPTGTLNTLPPFKESRLGDEVLFHLFYNLCGELYQLWAASELYGRGWRYHTSQQIWITRSQFSVHDQTANFERALYTYFDRNLWRKMTREMTIFFIDIEGRPVVPSHDDIDGKMN